MELELQLGNLKRLFSKLKYFGFFDLVGRFDIAVDVRREFGITLLDLDGMMLFGGVLESLLT